MFLKLSKKRILAILIIGFVLTLSTGTLLYGVQRPYNLYIRLKSISWPPCRYTQGNTSEYIYTNFGFDLTFEIWNPSNREYVFGTGNSNLLDPQMKIELEENYPVSSGYGFWIFITIHVIKPGLTERPGSMGILVRNYNDTLPPAGKYIIWAGIIDSAHLYSTPRFSYKSYETVLYDHYNDSEIDYGFTPSSWGKILPSYRKTALFLLWSLAGGDLIVLFHFYWISMRQKDKKLR
ncbi:MAG: hypothetical protein KAU62_18450 [Candidatus Heimdallarchaeota archaeon]|nr:hypothetical protein [Candidatus Heimdallarchaeota archaeon]MCG3258095.1 hypothetical protein [Candidatus Heimdallarchaeota archaeon]MCK4613145.1 hypothetical protein [Candidatus Heimdallarchaeota archaeon]